MKRILLILMIVAVAFPLGAAEAETKLETKLEGVKGQVESLVTAKDEKSGSELALRIETFKKVLEFSVSETKGLKLKLLALEDLSEKEKAWREAMIEELNNALAYYEDEKKLTENTAEMTLNEIKTIAADFKDWRDKTYLPVAEKINELLLIRQEEAAIETAESRWQKIDEDIKKLEKAKIKGVEELRNMLTDAGTLIGEGENLNREANGLFWESYSYLTTDDASNTTSTPEMAEVLTISIKSGAATTSSSTNQSATSTNESASSTLSVQPPSIKGLVGDSLTRVKDAYRIFIEMSNLVRKLL